MELRQRGFSARQALESYARMRLLFDVPSAVKIDPDTPKGRRITLAAFETVRLVVGRVDRWKAVKRAGRLYGVRGDELEDVLRTAVHMLELAKAARG